MILATSTGMRTLYLCVFLLGATTLASAQESPSEAPESEALRPTLTPEAVRALADAPPHYSNLEVLARATAAPDRQLAAPAALAASELAHAIDVFDVDQQEIPRSSLHALELEWLTLATQRERWVDLRIYALDVASRLHDLQRDHGAPTSDAVWRTFLEDDDPQMRAAALVLVPDAKNLQNAILPILTSDASEEVSLAAGQRLCGPLRLELANLPTLSDVALAKLGALARNRDLPIFDRVHLAPCLVANGSVESRRALGVLLQESPPASRRHLSTLLRVPKTEPSP